MSTTTDFRVPTVSKWSAPRAVADGAGGTIIATAEVGAPLEHVFRALTEPEQLERWWKHPDYYSTLQEMLFELPRYDDFAWRVDLGELAAAGR